ncbi:ammonium transporter, partial [Kouleothrix aurantiaca]
TIPGNTGTTGLLAGGGFDLLLAQIVGVVGVGLWSAATCGVMFYVLKRTVGLRVTPQEEIEGLDFGEHGAVAYPDLLPGAEAPVAAVPAGAIGSPSQA